MWLSFAVAAGGFIERAGAGSDARPPTVCVHEGQSLLLEGLLISGTPASVCPGLYLPCSQALSPSLHFSTAASCAKSTKEKRETKRQEIKLSFRLEFRFKFDFKNFSFKA
jgi:hypothetical protein